MLGKTIRLARVAWAFHDARKLEFASLAALEAHQQRALARFKRKVLRKSPYFSRFLDQPWSTWPLMDKQWVMAHFDAMNTRGLKRDELLAVAQAAEQSRKFEPWRGFSVGLSSGTSGQRGLFVADARERARWAGTILAKVLAQTQGDAGLRRQSIRAALFLRAGSDLYQTVNTRQVQLVFFDLFTPLARHLEPLAALRPTLIVAPAQVLRALGLALQAGKLQLEPRPRVISAAEVLPASERTWLETLFPRVDEIYQATEGFLGITCPAGRLHLNEEFLRVEPRWLDETRFLPIVTDFRRHTQPIVRYLLDDVLHDGGRRCPCGSPTRVIEMIEGRHDDALKLPGTQGEVITLFADVLHRVLARCLPPATDYRLIQQDRTTLDVALDADSLVEAGAGVRRAVLHFLATQAVVVGQLTVRCRALEAPDYTRKRRRIQCRWRAS